MKLAIVIASSNEFTCRRVKSQAWAPDISQANLRFCSREMDPTYGSNIMIELSVLSCSSLVLQ